MIGQFRFKRVIKASFPALKVPVDTLETIANIGEASILDNIKKQQQADGAALKENSPGWKQHKRKKRRPLLSLVNKFHRFVRGNSASWAQTIHPRSSRVKIEAATNELRDLAEYVQRMGYVGWFGLNKRAEKAMRTVVRKWVREEFTKARRKRT